MNITQAKDHVMEYKGIPFDELKVVYKELYEGIKEENTIDYLKDIGPKKVIEEFPKIQELVRELPSGEQLRSLIESVDGKITMEDIGLSNDIIKDSLTYSPFVRQRLTLMRVIQMIQ